LSCRIAASTRPTALPCSRWSRARRIPAGPSDHDIEELGPTGLRDPSVVRFKIFTLDNRILQRRIGRLGDSDAGGCAAALEAALREKTRAFDQADEPNT
jgi:hypothetical protein